MAKTTAFSCFAIVCASVASAQEQTLIPGVGLSVEGAWVNQQSSDLSGGGSFSVDRVYGRAGGFKRLDNGLGLGLFASYGNSDYDFSGAAPWGEVRESAISTAFSGKLNNGAQYFIAPSVRTRYERGASASDGRTAGVFAGISWQVSDNLKIGPAFGAFEGLGDDDVEVFPALLLDWKMSDRLSLSTGPTIGASRGPGLSLRYAMSNDWSVTLSARSEKNRFALSDSGSTPNGVGQDRSVPVVVSLGYAPNPAMSFSVFAGAEVDGQLRLEDATGSVVGRQSYDAAPIAGLAFSLAF